MPYYSQLKYLIKDKPSRNKVIDKLISLRDQLDGNIPAKDVENTLLLATWNVRDFDKENRRGYGDRLTESLFYIAEIISRFDLVAMQEVNRLNELQTVMNILGPNWSFIATDISDPLAGGNGERMTFLYDRRKVLFRNIAGEIVLPAPLLISKVTLEESESKKIAGKQFRRTPFIVSFQAGWFRFNLCTVHIYYGAESGDALKERVEEIESVAKFLSQRANIGLRDEDTALILLGDFNVVHPEHKTMKALLDNGFVVPKALQQKTNIDETKYYDQIAFKTKEQVIEFVDSQSEDPLKRNAGVFRLFLSAFRKNQVNDYKDAMAQSSNLNSSEYQGDFEKYYEDWRTYQLSDHNPLWVRLQVNESQDYLDRLRKKG